jgi:hypothetical protein
VAAAIGDLPVAFEPNVGQTDSQVRFLARTPGAIVFFTDSEAVMVLSRSEQGRSGRLRRRKPPVNWQREVVRMKLVGGEKPQASGLETLPGVTLKGKQASFVTKFSPSAMRRWHKLQ